jgi:hypothetical protein
MKTNSKTDDPVSLTLLPDILTEILRLLPHRIDFYITFRGINRMTESLLGREVSDVIELLHSPPWLKSSGMKGAVFWSLLERRRLMVSRFIAFVLGDQLMDNLFVVTPSLQQTPLVQQVLKCCEGEETPLPLRKLFIYIISLLDVGFGRESDRSTTSCVSVIADYVRYLDTFELSLLVALDQDGEFGGNLSRLIGGSAEPLHEDFTYLVPLLRILLNRGVYPETTTLWSHSSNLAAVHVEHDSDFEIEVYSWEGNILPGSSYHDPHRLNILQLRRHKDNYSPSCLCGCSPCHEECPLAHS